MSDVEKYLDAHKVYLDSNYKAGHFIASGRQEPRIGGIILCTANNKEHAQQILEADPFFIQEIAKYEVIEFIPTKYADGFEQFI